MRLNRIHGIKKILILLNMLLCIAIQAQASSFSGFMGAGASSSPRSDSNVPYLGGEAFFAGQYSLADMFLVRTELSVNTSDSILNEGVFQKTPAEFNIDELSLTMLNTVSGLRTSFAIFAGEYESIGSDVFLQRQFGIHSIGSRITETWQGLSGATIYPFSGIGLAYVLRFKLPMALGIYAYCDKQLSNIATDESNPTFNADIRFAGAWDTITVDSAFGVNLPIENKLDDGTKVIGLMRYVNLRGGLTLLIGNSYASSIFIQTGVSKITLNPTEDEKVVELSNVYLLCEPRFITEYVLFNFALFNIPETMAEKLFYITMPIGCDFCALSNHIYIAGYNFTIGAHLTLGAEFSDDDSLQINKDTLSLQVAPFISSTIFGGEINAALRLNTLKLPTIADNLSFTIGYRVQL